MAKKITKPKSIEETLWQSCDKLRGSVEPSEYKHVVLSLIFLKFASDKFEQRREELINEGKEKYVEMKDFYNMKNIFFLEDVSRWSFIKKNAKQNDIALKIDTALHTIEKDNPALQGALPDNYFSRLGLDRTKLASLIDKINEINTLDNGGQDLVGRVYEYFLKKFAIKEGKGKGEFYTPKTIVNLIAELIEPYKGIIYDPACGAGGMFVQSVKFIESHQGNKQEVSIYGQEYTKTTYKLAKMNLAIRGISANLGEKDADTFADDQHKDLKADFIMANPPFNQKDWRGADELLDDPRWMGYDVPPKSNANYGWILNMVSKLSENGVAGFILANGALSGGGEEYKIRKKLIENNLIEAIIIIPRDTFYTTDISVTLWIINKNKKARTAEINGKQKNYRNRENEVLFMDLRRWGSEYEKKFVELTADDITKVAENYHNWQQAPQPPEGEVRLSPVPEGGVRLSPVPEGGVRLPSVLKSSNPALYTKLKERAIKMRRNPTKAEAILWEELRNKKTGAKFRQQHIIDKFIVDFCSIEKRLIIEVDGDIHLEKVEYDAKRTTQLEKYGYKVIRFTNNEIIRNLEGVLIKIKEASLKSPLGDLGAYRDVPEFCKSASFDELKANNFSLVPSKYIEFIDRDSGIDFDTEMQRIQKDFKELLQEEKQAQNQLINAFKVLGYEL